MARRNQTRPPRQSYNPETDVPICFMVENPDGRILSAPLGGHHYRQYACACNVEQGLPKRSDPESHSLTIDARIVTCPDCQKTKVFQDAYLVQTGFPFEDELPVNSAAPDMEIADSIQVLDAEVEPSTPDKPCCGE